MQQARRTIVHVVYRFAIGGLENVIVQLVNRLPADRFDHVVLSLTDISDFRDRVTRPGVRFMALDKPPGHAVPLYPRIFRLLRDLRPDVIHTCNLAALEIAPIAWLAGVPLRVHAEHGWDAHDTDGSNTRYRRLRRLYRPFVSRYVAVSQDLHDYLERAIGVPSARRTLIANGVDTDAFHPRDAVADPAAAIDGWPFGPQDWVAGTVGRLQTVKNQPLLARAFVRLIRSRPAAASHLRLAIVGDGPLRAEVESVLDAGGMRHLAWLPGARNDVAAILRHLDCFVLPSQAEGTSCTLQEAMACGLPAVATAVGGTPGLVHEDTTGHLVPPDDEAALAEALWSVASDPARAARFGRAARRRALDDFALDGMVAQYDALFSAGRSIARMPRP
jgi:sugar transferase (PEP-CTERM/EpsH1 system associated)